MNTINLKVFLIILMVLLASLSLISIALFITNQTHSRTLQQTNSTAEAFTKHIQVQLLFSATKDKSFLLFLTKNNLLFKSELNPGFCVQFERPDTKILTSACKGSKLLEPWPLWFEHSYLRIYKPEYEVKKAIIVNGNTQGWVVVTYDFSTAISNAWIDIKKLMGLSIILVLISSSLLYFAIDWILRPAQTIVTALEKMAEGNLSLRLPSYRIKEWDKTAKALNILATNLEKTLLDKNKLTEKLVTTQEDERRYITRELHDELGQSLAAMAAISSSIVQTAKEKCPELVSDGKQISRITTSTMKLLNDILLRIRAIDFDQLSFTESLQNLVSDWNIRCAGMTNFQLDIQGDFQYLTDEISVNLYRIVQEGLTNISKHSAAKIAKVKLEIINDVTLSQQMQCKEFISLSIEDDGISDSIDFSNCSGIGLIGIQERVNILGGELNFILNNPSGLTLQIMIPL